MTENTPLNQDISGQAVVASEPAVSVDEKALGDIYDRLMKEDGRDDQGRFTAKESAASLPADQAAPERPGAEDGTEAPSSSERPMQSVALPPNWPKDKAQVFADIPEAARGAVQEVLQGLHAKMSDQGRALSAYRDLDPIVADMKANYPEHFTGQDAKTPAQVINYLYSWQRAMDENPVAALLKIADNYNVVPQLVQHFTQAGQPQGAVPAQAPQADVGTLLKQIEQRVMAQLSPDRLEQQITSVMSKSQTQEAITRFAAERPHWADVEPVLPDFIKIAKAQQPEAAPMALLEAAYDMAVHANPATRSKVSAAAPAAVAKQADEKRAAAAKAANQLNIKTTSSGKKAFASEDEALSAAYDRVMSAA